MLYVEAQSMNFSPNNTELSDRFAAEEAQLYTITYDGTQVEYLCKDKAQAAITLTYREVVTWSVSVLRAK